MCTATTVKYTLSLHDALPISAGAGLPEAGRVRADADRLRAAVGRDRKSTRLNSSHLVRSYAVSCLKKEKAGGYGRVRSLCASTETLGQLRNRPLHPGASGLRS